MIPCIINTQKSTLKNEAFFFRNKPYKTPARNAVSVKPGKYAPTGNKNAEITSPIAATIPPATGPYKTAAITIGTKLNSIFKFHVCMEKRANIISAATHGFPPFLRSTDHIADRKCYRQKSNHLYKQQRDANAVS